MRFFHAHSEHIVKASINSLAGLRTAFRDEMAFRQILFWAIPSIGLALIFGTGWLETVLLITPAFLSVIVELLNTAVENAVDLAHPQWHLLAKKAKDTASAAQFLTQIFALGDG